MTAPTAPTAPRQISPQDWSLLLMLSVLWGGGFFFAGVALRELPPLTLVLARVVLASLILLPVFWARGHRLPRGIAGWLPFAGMGLLNNVLPFALIFAGQTQITVGLSSIINALTPLFTVLVLATFREERLSARRLAGVGCGILGIVILNSGGGASEDARALGIALCMGGALSYGFAALWGRRRLGGIAPLKSATCQLIASSVIMAVLASVVDRPWTLPMPGGATLAAVLALAVFATALAYILFFRILAQAGASTVMLVTLLIPITALALGAVFLGEPLHARDVVGALVIGLGLIVIDGRVFHRRTVKRQA